MYVGTYIHKNYTYVHVHVCACMHAYEKESYVQATGVINR